MEAVVVDLAIAQENIRRKIDYLEVLLPTEWSDVLSKVLLGLDMHPTHCLKKNSNKEKKLRSFKWKM